MQNAGTDSAGFLLVNVAPALKAVAGVSRSADPLPCVRTGKDVWPTGVPAWFAHRTETLVVPLVHVTEVRPPVPTVQVIEFVGLPAPPGAAKIAAAKVPARKVPSTRVFVMATSY